MLTLHYAIYSIVGPNICQVYVACQNDTLSPYTTESDSIQDVEYNSFM